MIDKAVECAEGILPASEPTPVRRHLVLSAGYWFNAAREQQENGKMATALHSMENAYNHVENALAVCMPKQFGESTQPDSEAHPFDFLVAGMAAGYAKDYEPPTDLESAMETVHDAFTMIQSNLDDGDPITAVIQNLADLTCATRRMANLAATLLTPEQFAAIIAENQP